MYIKNDDDNDEEKTLKPFAGCQIKKSQKKKKRRKLPKCNKYAVYVCTVSELIFFTRFFNHVHKILVVPITPFSRNKQLGSVCLWILAWALQERIRNHDLSFVFFLNKSFVNLFSYYSTRIWWSSSISYYNLNVGGILCTNLSAKLGAISDTNSSIILATKLSIISSINFVENSNAKFGAI